MKLKTKKYLSLILSFAMLFSYTISTIADTVEQTNEEDVNTVEYIDVEQGEPVVAKANEYTITCHIYTAADAAKPGELGTLDIQFGEEEFYLDEMGNYSVTTDVDTVPEAGYEDSNFGDLKWYTNSNFTGEPIDTENDTVDQSDDIYARANPKHYDLAISTPTTGVTNSLDSSERVYYDGTFSALGGVKVTPATDYKFDGRWKLMKNGVEQETVTADAPVPSKIITEQAEWSVEPIVLKQYNITYYLNGEEVTSSDYSELLPTYSTEEPIIITSQSMKKSYIDAWFADDSNYYATPMDIDTTSESNDLTFYGWKYNNEYQLQLKQYVREAVQASNESALSEAYYYNAVKAAVIYYMENLSDIGDLKSVDSDLYNKIEGLKNDIISYNRTDNGNEASGLQLVKILDASGNDVTSDYWYVGIEVEACSADLSNFDNIIDSFDIYFTDWRDGSDYTVPTGFTAQIQIPYGDNKNIDTSKYENIRLRYGAIDDGVLSLANYEKSNEICSFSLPSSSSVVFTGDLKNAVNPGSGSGAGGSSSSGGVYSTGDSTPVVLLILFALAAFIVILCVLVLRKKRNKN